MRARAAWRLRAGAALACVAGAALLLVARYTPTPSPATHHAARTPPPPTYTAALLLAARYTPTPSPATHRAARTPPPPTYTAALLAATRALLTLDMVHYNYSRCGARALSDLQPAAGGRPLRSLVVSTWRSGSSFLGHLLSSVPATLYFFEPMWTLNRVGHFRKPPQNAKAVALLRNIMKCKHDGAITKQYFKWSSGHVSTTSMYWHVIQFWKQCSPENSCYEPEFLSKLYELFPIQIIKLARIRLHLIEDLLNDDELNLKIVVLVRDPRAVMYSRLKIDDFCSDEAVEDCEEPTVLCKDMERDYATAARLQQAAPGRVTVLRFEDLALNLNATAEQLFQFLKLDLTPSVHKFIQTHSNASNSNPNNKNHYSTCRNTKDVPFQWQKNMQFSIVKELQRVCRHAMSLWGYVPAHNASHLASAHFTPLSEYSNMNVNNKYDYTTK